MGYREGIEYIVAVVCAVFLLLCMGCVFLINAKTQREICKVHATSYNAKYNFWTGCMVQDPKSGIWMYSDKIEQINGTLDVE